MDTDADLNTPKIKPDTVYSEKNHIQSDSLEKKKQTTRCLLEKDFLFF